MALAYRLRPAAIDVHRRLKRLQVGMSTRDIAERCELVPLVAPTGGRDSHLVSISVELLDLGEQRPNQLHRIVMALHEVWRCSTCHGKDDLGCFITALNEKVIHRVCRTGLE